jgi:hypothetical protein
MLAPSLAEALRKRKGKFVQERESTCESLRLENGRNGWAARSPFSLALR